MLRGFELNLHATRAEILSFAADSLKEYPVHAFAQKFGPFKADLVKCSDLDAIRDDRSPYNYLMFTSEEPIYPVLDQFPVEYPDSLFLPLPRIVDNILPQITLGFSVRKGDEYNEEAVKIWMSMHKNLKKSTKAGVKTLFTKTGNMRGPNKSDRYTPGAEDAFKKGVVLGLSAGAIGILEVGDDAL